MPPTVSKRPGDTVVYTGQNESFTCTPGGDPTPEISYFFNATKITTGVSGGTLTLTRATAANTGPYQCFANNVRAVNSNLWIVTVRDPGEYCYYYY